MAFDTSVIVLKGKYHQNMAGMLLEETSRILSGFNIAVEKTVSVKEYEDMTSSKEINRYVRIRKSDLKEQKDQAFELVKVGTTRVQAFAQFASAKYAFMSVSDFEDAQHTVIWFSFHSRLYRAFGEFKDLPFRLAQRLSENLGSEVYVLSTSSLSRNSDKFILYVRGRERNKISSKGALTEVRSMYGIDINKVMTNIDKNLAIHYAPSDYQDTIRELNEQKERFETWKTRRHELKQNEHGKLIENKEDGTEYVDVFEKENEVVIASLRQKLDGLKVALRTDPIGVIMYFKMKDLGPGRTWLPANEREFGRDVRELGSSAPGTVTSSSRVP